MNCPLKSRDQIELLLEYSAQQLTRERAASVDRHLEGCADCRRFVEEQQAVWAALDSWKGPEVTSGFDERLYRRIENDRPWWEALVRPLRAFGSHRGLVAAAAACLVITAGVVLENASRPVAPPKPDTAVVDVQPEQVEKALDAMDVLSEFSRKARTEGAGPRL
jgi:anti-sigma factor RsiW